MVSVIIVNYNTFKLTSACIESVIRFTKDVAYEIVLVDNASSECDPGLFTKHYPQLKLIRSSANLGFSKGNNLGIAHAEGDVILLLNSDTVLISDSISLSYHRLKSDAACGVLSCKLIYEDGRIQHAPEQFRTIKQEVYELFKLHRFLKPLPSTILQSVKEDQEHYTDWVWGTFYMIKREVLKKFPGEKLHETFFMYGEDKQWCFHIHKLGYKVLYYPAVSVVHHISSSSGLKEENKFKNFIWPHEKKFMQAERGKTYAFLYFILKGLNAYATRNKTNFHWGNYFFKLAIGKIKSKW